MLSMLVRRAASPGGNAVLAARAGLQGPYLENGPKMRTPGAQRCSCVGFRGCSPASSTTMMGRRHAAASVTAPGVRRDWRAASRCAGRGVLGQSSLDVWVRGP